MKHEFRFRHLGGVPGRPSEECETERRSLLPPSADADEDGFITCACS